MKSLAPSPSFSCCLSLSFALALACLGALSVLASSSAAAQPAAVLQAPPGATEPCSPCYLTPPYDAAPRVALTPSDLRLLQEGEISSGRHVGGVLAAVYFGFGLGHVVEGRWAEKGWIFTVGEPIALAMMVKGLVELTPRACLPADPDRPGSHGCGGGERSRSAKWMLLGGVIGLVGLRTWEIVDSYTGPQEHNRKVRQLRALSGQDPYQEARLAPYLVPSDEGAGAMAGVAARF